jgi:hypothetical protein
MPEHDNRGLEPGGEQRGAEFDILLRSSLDTYADAGADSGLAKRVLARIAVEGERERIRRTNRTRRISRWAIALPVAACLIVAFLLLASKPLHNSADGANQARVTLPKSTDAVRIADRGGSNANSLSVTARRNNVLRPLRHPSRAAVAATAERLPKLDVFPTPQPLTAAEKEFVAYVAHTPPAERQSLIEDEKRIDAPLTIAAIEIKPLELPEPQGN